MVLVDKIRVSDEIFPISPNDMLLKIRNFLVNQCLFTVVREIADDLDIGTGTFSDGQLCILKDPINKYYIYLRSANSYNIWGNSYTTAEDKIKKDSIAGIGLLMSTEYNDKFVKWYDQDKTPLYFKNNYVVRYGVNIPYKKDIFLNYCYNGEEAYTCLISCRNKLDETPVTNMRYSISHTIFGNLHIFNKVNVDSNEVGGFMISNETTDHGTAETKTDKIKVGGKPIKKKTKTKTANLHQPSPNNNLVDIFSSSGVGSTTHINVTYGDYPTQAYDVSYIYGETDIKDDKAEDKTKHGINNVDAGIIGCYWASSPSFNGGDIGGFDRKSFLELFSILSKLNPTALAYSKLCYGYNYFNKDTYDCKTFGLPIIPVVNSNPLYLDKRFAVGEVYGVYFISTYCTCDGSLHVIKTYNGLTYAQLFSNVRRDIGSYIGLAILSKPAEEELSDSMGGREGL